MKYGMREACFLPAGRQALPSHLVFERKSGGCYKTRLLSAHTRGSSCGSATSAPCVTTMWHTATTMSCNRHVPVL
jgi:hypothetical protein